MARFSFAFFTLFHLSLTFFRPEVPFNFMFAWHSKILEKNNTQLSKCMAFEKPGEKYHTAE